MFFAETANHCFTSEHIKQSCLTNCAYLILHQRIHWGHNADSTNARSLNFYSGRGYPPAGATPTSPTIKIYLTWSGISQLHLALAWLCQLLLICAMEQLNL